MHARRLSLAFASATLLLAACGGSDDAEPAADDSVASADESGETGDDSGDEAGDVFTESDPADDDGAVADDGSDGGDDDSGDGSGTNDEAQESLDDAGIDVDLDELEETVTGMSTGEGGGEVVIDGATYAFAAEICIVQGNDFTAEGLGEAPDGTPAWVSISYSADGFDFDNDGEGDTTFDLFVEVGKSELFGSGADDQPDWSASKLDAATMQTGEDITVQLDGGTLSGSGPIQDFNGVAIPFGESVDMTFQATCS